MKRFILVLAFALAAGCSTTPHRVGPSSSADWIRTELFFGFAKPDGSLVGAEEWNTFLDQHILRRFPNGLTVVDATGRYLDRQGRTIKEPSKVVVLFYPTDRVSIANSNIAAIVTEYCTRHQQESVLRTDSKQKASFLSPKP